MALILHFVYLLAVTVTVASATVIRPKANVDWWKTAVVYQIYPRSFKDSNNDGTGDLKGIISKLEHLKDAGVTAAWLSPIYKSPQVDQGYDISDYMQIDALFGTMADFDELVKKAHELGIKIIMDFVPNHSSDQHQWFIDSEKSDEKYKDYYIWRDGKAENVPPNNWVSLFQGPAWTYSENRKQWYLHSFAKEQPDLNYRHQPLVEDMKKVLKFWLDKGVDGFRMDAVPYLVEHESFGDEPQLNNTNAKPGDYEYLNHILTMDQPETYNVVYEWRDFIDNYNNEHITEDPRIMMTEAYTTLENTMKYYTDGKRNGAHFSFNFFLITDLQKTSKVQDIISTVQKWINEMPKGGVANWVIGNHDQHRAATRYGIERVDGMNMLIAFLPGVMVTYNGEEIGQENGKVPWAMCKDPRACKGKEEDYEANSRDFERTPFHWDDSINAGFNEGKETWLPVSEKYITNNLKAQSSPGVQSYFHTYKSLLKLRQDPKFANADVSYEVVNDNVMALIKTTAEPNDYVALINIGNKKEQVDLSKLVKLNKHVKVVATSSSSKKSNRVLTVNDITLEPYESFIAKSIPDATEGNMMWWKNSLIYEIYPLSFKDTDNDGKGDIRGIISQLPHIKEIGATAIWIAPMYTSTNIDQGYDVQNHLDIDQVFGKMQDFDELIKEAHKIGVKVIMEYIPNHTSNKHEWFTKSELKDPGYTDFYVWKKTESETKPPNNWISMYNGPAWSYSAERKEWYLHQFAKEEPDLNYRNPLVVENMKNVLRFWLDKQVDGFRVHSANSIFENQNLENEDVKNPSLPDDDYNKLIHKHTIDQSENFDLVYTWREVLNDYVKEHGGDARILMIDANSDIKKVMEYYGNEQDQVGGHIVSNYQLINDLNVKSNARDVILTIKKWLDQMPLPYVANWMLGNHDFHRVASRLGSENVDGFNMLVSILPGAMITYNGEEIGQPDGEVTFDQCQDPKGCKNKDTFKETSRDFGRTPFHWNSLTNAGFSEGKQTWLPVSETYKKINLAYQKEAKPNSHYQVFKQILELRKDPIFRDGNIEIHVVSDNVLTCARKLKDQATYVFIFNLGSAPDTVEIAEILNIKEPSLKIVSRSSESLHQIGRIISSKGILMNAHESIIAITTTDPPTTETTTSSTTTSTSTTTTTTTTTTTVTPSTTTTVTPSTTTTTVTPSTTTTVTPSTTTTTTTTTVAPSSTTTEEPGSASGLSISFITLIFAFMLTFYRIV